MIDMDPTPAPAVEVQPIISNDCSIEEQETRLNVCKSCTRFWLNEEQKTYCLEANKSIAFMITNKTISCPLGKW